MDSFRPKLKLQDIRVGLIDLTTGRNLVESAESIYVKKMMDGQLAETIAQEKLITAQDGCRIKVIQVGRKLYM